MIKKKQIRNKLPILTKNELNIKVEQIYSIMGFNSFLKFDRYPMI